MKIAICGSLTFEQEMKDIQAQLESAGYETCAPFSKPGADIDPVIRKELVDDYFAKISDADAILVVNMPKNDTPGYIGGNVLMEITLAYSQGLEIFLLNAIPEQSYAVELAALEPILLNGEIGNIDTYFAMLPKVFMSTESPVKHRAVSRGLRKAGIRTQISGVKVESGVNEQPFSVDETYEGAMNRHANLRALNQVADYYVTIESGQHSLHKNHGTFGNSVIVIEPAGRDPKVHIAFDVEFPRAMTDKVPSQYPDLGALVQAEYGSKLKDPFPYFTGGKMTRTKILEDAVYDTAIQL